MTESQSPVCLVCQRTEQQTPLISFRYRGADRWICPAHLPVLIHHPEQLDDVLPGAGDLSPADHHDHD
jgi:hypothetical protein